MLEGNLYYDERLDYWYIIKDDGQKINIGGLIYGLRNHIPYFSEKAWIGEGEYFKLTIEIDGKII